MYPSRLRSRLLSIYEELFSSHSKSWILEDWANAAATACRSRNRDMSSLAATTLVVVVTVFALGMATVVL